MKPLGNRVIVEKKAPEQKTAGGIIIPDSISKDEEKPQRGTVLSVGPGLKNEPMTVKPGDVIQFGAYAGSDIDVDGKECLIMRETDILCIEP